jgi:hypothetical protein
MPLFWTLWFNHRKFKTMHSDAVAEALPKLLEIVHFVLVVESGIATASYPVRAKFVHH